MTIKYFNFLVVTENFSYFVRCDKLISIICGEPASVTIFPHFHDAPGFLCANF